MDADTTPDASPDSLLAIAWLEGLADDPLGLEDLDEELRARLYRVLGRMLPPDHRERSKRSRQRMLAKRARKRKHDDALLAETSNRALKRSLRFPVAPPSLAIDAEARHLLEVQAEHSAAAAARLAAPSDDDGEAGTRPERLLEPKSCYICKEDFVVVHGHYDSMCPACADVNWQKRLQTSDLTGRVALITGSRVKIGYEAVLKLLRAGARVVATTRFPHDAARRYARESDFAEWSDRLEVHGLDLRHTPSVEAFAQKMLRTLPRLDFLIHNACQTVRRPPHYYTHLIEAERVEEASEAENSLIPASQPDAGDVGMTHSAALSQLDLLGEAGQSYLFPRGMHDGEGQQLDLRASNSWRMQLDDVPTVELLEVQLVNSIAPFVLTARLKSLMVKVETPDKHVVNVSAMEGQFDRRLKTTRHPHTNMAKAALNMMTRTSASDFVRSGIHMNSVDTGWVTDEDPFAAAVRKESEQRFIPPLDSIDGAARILDPIFTGFLTGTHCWGQFLKDYAPTNW